MKKNRKKRVFSPPRAGYTKNPIFRGYSHLTPEILKNFTSKLRLRGEKSRKMKIASKWHLIFGPKKNPSKSPFSTILTDFGFSKSAKIAKFRKIPEKKTRKIPEKTGKFVEIRQKLPFFRLFSKSAHSPRICEKKWFDFRKKKAEKPADLYRPLFKCG